MATDTLAARVEDETLPLLYLVFGDIHDYRHSVGIDRTLQFVRRHRDFGEQFVSSVDSDRGLQQRSEYTEETK